MTDSVRVRLAGPLAVTCGTVRHDAARFPGRQGRLVFAALALANGRPVERDSLAEIVWPNGLPPAWTRDLSVIVSKLRVLFGDEVSITTGRGRWYALAFHDECQIDIVDAQANACDAEQLAAKGEPASAFDAATAAIAVLREPFLAGDDCPWVDEVRSDLHASLRRALVVRADTTREIAPADSVRAAHAVVALTPHDESSFLLLMRAQLAQGDRVEAARTYERLRKTLSEFGLSPSAESAELLRVALDDEVAQLPFPGTLADASARRFVARERELATVVDALSGSSTERVVLVAGEPGIGKSRLAAAAAANAYTHGADVLFAAASDGQSVPYALVTDAFAAFGIALPGDAIHREGTRRELFAAYASAVARHTQQRSLLVVLDDVHWADASSIDLLERLVEEVPMLRVVLTARLPEIDRAPASQFVTSLQTRGLLRRVALGGLDVHAVGELLDADDASFAAAVCNATAGNPLYVQEIRRHLSATGYPAVRDENSLIESIGLPAGLLELIDANLARFGSPARRVLETSAAAGEPFEIAVVERSCDVASADVVDALRTLQRAGIVVEVAQFPNPRARFAHPLLREVLLQGLGPERRQRLHQRIAEAIEAVHHDDLDTYAPQLAYHFSIAANVGDETGALDFAVRAAERANAVLAFAEAIQWYEYVLRILPETSAERGRRIQLLIALGYTHLRAGNLDDADRFATDALNEAVRSGDPTSYAEAVLMRTRLLVDRGFEGGAVDGELVGHLERAIAQLEPPNALRARLAARLAGELHFAGDHDRCDELARNAVAEARACDDPDAQHVSLAFLHYTLFGTPRVHERLELLREMQWLQTGKPDPRWQRDYLELGDLAAAENAAKIFEHRAATSGFATDRYYPAVWRATVATLRGQLDVAEVAAGEAADIGRASARGPQSVAGVWGAQLFAIRLFDGRLHELRDLVADTAALNRSRPVWTAAAAFMHLELDDTAAAEEAFDHLRTHGFDRLPVTLDLPLTLALCAWVGARLGTLEDCECIAQELEPYRDLSIVQGGPAPSIYAGPASYPLAVLAARLGRRDEAVDLFEQAATSAQRVDAPLWLERMRRDQAQALQDTQDS